MIGERVWEGERLRGGLKGITRTWAIGLVGGRGACLGGRCFLLLLSLLLPPPPLPPFVPPFVVMLGKALVDLDFLKVDNGRWQST